MLILNTYNMHTNAIESACECYVIMNHYLNQDIQIKYF